MFCDYPNAESSRDGALATKPNRFSSADGFR